MPASDGGDAFIWVGGPGDGLWLCVVLVGKAINGGLEVDDGSEDAALQLSLRQLGEEALNGIAPGAGCRRDAEDEALVPVGPPAHRGCLRVA